MGGLLSTEIANAYIALTAKFPNIKKDIEEELGKAVPKAAKAPGEAAGKSLLDGMGNVLKGGALALGGLAAAGIGTALVKGFQRLDALDQASAKLSGLGHSAEGVDKIMSNALSSVKGTAFGMGDAATVAAQVVAAGVEPGKDLERTLKLVGDAATIAGTDMGTMGSVISKVATSDMMQMDVANQLMDAGIPIMQLLASEMGVTAEEARKMASAGEVSFSTFQNALESGMGGAALESGNTFQGAMDNVLAALGRVGESMLGGVFENMKGEFGDLTSWIDSLGPAFDDFGADVGAFANDAIPVVIDAITGLVDGIIALVTFVRDNSTWLAPLGVSIGVIVGAIIAWNVVTQAWIAMQAIVAGVQAAYIAYTYGMTAATYGYTGASKIATAAQWLFNAALNANPIALIVLALAALVAGLVYFFTQTELGQQVWGEFTRFLGEAWTNIVNVVSTAATWLWETVLKPTFDAIGAVFTWLYENVISPVVQGIVLYVQLWAAIFTWIYESIIVPVVTGIAAFINDVLIPVFQGIWDVVSFVFEAVSAIIQIAWGVMSYIFQQIVSFIQNTLGAVFTWLYEFVILPVWTAIQNAISFAWTVIQVIFTAIQWYINNVLAPVFTWLYNSVILPVWTAIQLAISTVYDWFVNTLVPGFQAVIAVFGAAFSWVNINVIQPVWRAIQDAIWNVYNWFNGTLVPIFKSAIDAIGAAFNTVKDTIGKAWESIKTAAMAPVKFVVESVYRDGIKKLFDGMAEKVGLDIRMPDAPTLAFARGGVLPGYTPGRDVHNFYSPTGGRLALSGGEGIIRPDALRALGGKGWLDAVNSSRGSADGVHFANGGVWDDLGKGVGDVVGWIGGAVENVAKIFTDPGGAVNALIREPVKELLANIGGGSFGEIVAEVPLKAIDGIVEWAKNTIKPPATSTGGGNWIGGNTLERLRPLIAKHGLSITDTYRDPAYNASVGGSPTSYHMDKNNPAVDVAGSYAAMDAFVADVRAVGGWRQILWEVAGHYDHAHVAAQGGIFGDLPTKKYDAGGYLQPGYTQVYNGTGKPEPVFTSGQWADIENMANSGGDITLLVDGDPAMVELVKLMDIRIKGDGERRALNVMAGASRV